MSQRTDLPMADQAGAAVATTEALPGTFIGLGLDLKSDKPYDLGGAIPDVIRLRAAVVKVMSVPDSCCVRVVVYRMDFMRSSYMIWRMRNHHCSCE